LQDLPVPQMAPSAADTWSVQTGAPDPQAKVAEIVQGLIEVQLEPVVHALQIPPAEQTRFAPHAVPPGTKD
jgi:hypothetical protein